MRGESLRSLTMDLNRRKIGSTTGRLWTATHLRGLLCNPRFAGLTVYRGAIVGKRTWPAIIRPVDSARLREHFSNRDKQNHSEFSPNILSGLVFCGRCGSKTVATRVSPASQRRRYSCPNMPDRKRCGRLSVAASHIEASASEAIVLRVASLDVQARPVRASVRDRRWVKANAELDRSQRLLDALATDLGEGRITRREWLLMRPEIAERIAKSTAVVIMQDRYDAGNGEFIGNPAHLTILWPDMHVSRRRTVMSRPYRQHHRQAGTPREAPLRPLALAGALAGGRPLSATTLAACATADNMWCARLQTASEEPRAVPNALRTVAASGRCRRRPARRQPLVTGTGLQGYRM